MAVEVIVGLVEDDEVPRCCSKISAYPVPPAFTMQPGPVFSLLEPTWHDWTRHDMTIHDSVFPPWDPIGATGLGVSGGGVGFYVHT